MPNANISITMPTPIISATAVTTSAVISAINGSNQLSEEVKEVAIDMLDKHSADGFRSIEELLGVGLPPDVVEALKFCNDVIQLFL